MSALDDLRSAGFSDAEVGDYATQQRATLSSAGFSDAEINQHLGPTPDTAGANKSFARVIGDQLSKISQTLNPEGKTVAEMTKDREPISPVAGIEAALNAGTGLLFGFPAYVGAGLGGLASKYLLGSSADPKELAETMSKVFTYQPQTAAGQRLTGNVMMPLTLLQQGSEKAGQTVSDLATKAGAGTNTAAAAGAVTDATLQMLAPVLLGELGRKMGGQTVTADDMHNTAKVIAGQDATPEAVQATQDSLHKTYEQTGIGPYTVLKEAEASPDLRAEMADPAVGVPKAFEPYLEKPAAPDEPVPGDGAPVLDVSGQTLNEEATGAGQEAAMPTVTSRDGSFVDTRGGEDRFHGTGKPIESLSDEYALSGDSRNIYGQGFYTTDAADIAAGYMKKGGADAVLYKVGGKTVPLYDMDSAMSPEIADIARQNMGDNFPTENAETGKPLTTLREVYDEFRAESKNNGLPRDEVQEVFDGIRYKLEEQGYRGFQHEGGAATRRPAHKVQIFWHPESDVSIAKADISDYHAKSIATEPTSARDIQQAKQAAKRTVRAMLKEGDITSEHAFRGTSLDELQEIARTGELVIGRNAEGEPATSAATVGKGDFAAYGNGSGYIAAPEMVSKSGLAGEVHVDPMSDAKQMTYLVNGKAMDFAAMKEAVLGKDGAPKSKADAELDDWLKQYIGEKGVVEMNAGLNPAASLRAIRDSYTPFVGVESPHAPVKPVADAIEKGAHPVLDSLQKIFAPASRGDVAATQAGIMRANFGEMAREREVALTKMKDFAAQFDKLPVEENVKFIDAYEHGVKLADPQLNAAAEALHALNKEKREEVQALGKGQLENFDENYLGRIWKDPQAESDMVSRRPLTGSGAFLKARSIPFYKDGLRFRAYDAEGDFIKSFDTEAQAKAAAGADGRVGQPLTPVTTNPVEMALLKAREMDKYIYGQKIFQEMKASNLAKFVGFGEHAPAGWTKINDKIARVLQPNEGEGGGMILRGEYYAPDEAATLINNHLSSGFQGNGFYDAWRGIGNAINGLQLGLSAFHVGFTSMDAMISKASLGVKQISRGDVVEGVGNVAQGLNPAQPFLNIYKGDKLLRAYLGELNNPDLMPIVDAIQQAGGRVKMDDFYRNAQVNAFKQALRAEDYTGAAKAFLPTVLDRISAPIFEYLVPRQKLGVFFDMSKDWIKQNPEATVAEKREGMGKLWDSVDNRMGQLVYDNVFWDRALKDGLMATVRSVGWNLGTFRELGGGVLDIKDIAKNKGFSDRTSYLVALPLIASIYGSILNYAYTGEAPQSLKDAFYPKTGKLRPDGSEDRVSLPTYMKDVFAYGEDMKNFVAYGGDPTQTIKNKLHPLIATVSEMLNNKDFFGGAIRNPADKAVEQLADEAAFIIQQFSPFSYRNYLQQAKAKGEEPSVMGYLTSPSMIGITPAPGYIAKSPEELESGQVSQMHDSLVTKFKEEIKGGKDVETLIPQMLKSGMTKRDIKYIISSSGDVPKPHKLKSFGKDDE